MSIEDETFGPRDPSEWREGSTPEGHVSEAAAQARAAKLAESILADKNAPESTPKSGPRRNRHLDGYGDPRNAD